MKLITLMINNQQDVPIDEMRNLTSRFDFVIYKFSVQRLRFLLKMNKTFFLTFFHREIYCSGGRKKKRDSRKEKMGGRKEKTTPCPPPHRFRAGFFICFQQTETGFRN